MLAPLRLRVRRISSRLPNGRHRYHLTMRTKSSRSTRDQGKGHDELVISVQHRERDAMASIHGEFVFVEKEKDEGTCGEPSTWTKENC